MELAVKNIIPEEYLKTDRQVDYKNEYLDNKILAMSGASRNHNLIVTNIIRELSQQSEDKDCEIYPNDMRVMIYETQSYTYPDVIVVCGKPEFADSHIDTLLNPTVIIEVLSPSTEAYDRGKKFEAYRKLDSLKEYLLISQDKPLIEHYVRQTEKLWLLSESDRIEDTIELAAVGCLLKINKVYKKVLR